MPGKLLLADDSVTVQRVIELTFADQGMQVVSVGDGARAIERAEQERPDIILADVSMPERDGYEVARYVKRTPHLASVPVILMTGAFEQLDEARAREVGCDAVLAKPFEPHMVISLVRQLLGQDRRVPPDATTPASTATSQAQVPEPLSSATGSLDAYLEQLDDALSAAAGSRERQPVETASTGDTGRATTGEEEVPSLSDAFSALLAEELGESPLPAAWGALAGAQPRSAARQRRPAGTSTLDAPPPITEEFLDEVARRVTERMAASSHDAQPAAQAPASAVAHGTPELLDAIAAKLVERIPEETVRAVVNQRVLDVAERLVREEIEKIKAEAR